MSWYVVVIGQSVVNAACFAGGVALGRWYLRRKHRPRKPISLPGQAGLTPEETEADAFIKELSDDTRDDIRLVSLDSTPPWRHRKPLAISATAFEDNLRRMRSYMDKRRSETETLLDESMPAKVKTHRQ